MTLNFQIRSFSEIFALQHTFQEWIAPKWLEIDQDSLHTKFSPLNIDFCSQSFDSLRLRMPAHTGVKEGYSLKSGYFSTIGLSVMKTVADRHRHVAYHNKHWWHAFNDISIDDLEWPWTPKIRVFSDIILRLLAAEVWIATKWMDAGASAPYKPWSKCCKKKIEGKVFWKIRGKLNIIILHFWYIACYIRYSIKLPSLIQQKNFPLETFLGN